MKSPAFLFYFKDFALDTSQMTAKEVGWYIRLLCNQAELGSLPSDPEQLALLALVSYKDYPEWKQSWKRTLSAKFGAEDEADRLFNRKLRDVMQKREDYSLKQQLRGLKGSYSKKIAKEFPEIGDSAAFLNTLITVEFLKMNEKERTDVLTAYAVSI